MTNDKDGIVRHIVSKPQLMVLIRFEVNGFKQLEVLSRNGTTGEWHTKILRFSAEEWEAICTADGGRPL